jgi:two-component system, OmpR family, phosphate regulon response regulator PhoB
MSHHVLVVEDDADIAHLINIRLTMRGYEARIVSNGAEAISVLDEFQPGVVVTDWMMPVLTGIEMSAAIRSQEAGPQPRIIMLTARASEADELRARAAGVDDYLTKPVSFPLLMERVEAGFAA